MTLRSDNNATGRIAVMAGSFRPFTLGHLSILTRGLKIFDKIIVLAGQNASKPSEAAERNFDELHGLLAPLSPKVEVRRCTGLVAAQALSLGACALLRGVRSVADYEYERNMAEVNRVISGMETLLLFAEPQLAAVSSSVVRELTSYGMDVSNFLPSEADIQQTKNQLK